MLRGAGQAHGPLATRTVDVALNEAMLSVMESLVPDYCAYGIVRTRTGGRMQGGKCAAMGRGMSGGGDPACGEEPGRGSGAGC